MQRPLASPRPTHYFSKQSHEQCNVGDFVFFSDKNDSRVFGGVILTKSDDGSEVSIHEHRQADKRKTRFTPLYQIRQSGRFEVRQVPLPHHSAAVRSVLTRNIHVSGVITNYHIHPDMLNRLKTLGILHE